MLQDTAALRVQGEGSSVAFTEKGGGMGASEKWRLVEFHSQKNFHK